jgi:glutathione S-transferase
MAAREPAVLITIPISHYCEKARWALDRTGVRYRERRHMQGVHRVVVRRAGGVTAPVLVDDGLVLSESAQIVDHADARGPADRRLYPDDPDRAAEIRSLERVFDERLGPHGRRWMYRYVGERPDLVTAYSTPGVPEWQRRALPIAYPVLKRFIDRILDITPATAAQSELEVRAVFDEVGQLLDDGRPFLVGDGFTAADLTFSALAAAVLLPPEYVVRLPGIEELPAPMAAVVRELREHPAGAHALAMYRSERR